MSENTSSPHTEPTLRRYLELPKGMLQKSLNLRSAGRFGFLKRRSVPSALRAALAAST